MNTNYVLIDFENVQPESLRLLPQEHFKVLVFVGPGQTKVPFDVAASLQEFGDRAKYVKVSARGPNALDFHIAYYLGRLATAEPTARFHVISKDTGFDPLLDHLRSQQIPARRVATVAEVPRVDATTEPVSVSPMSRIAQAISGPVKALPRTDGKPTSSTSIAPAAQQTIKPPAKPVVQPSVKPVAKPALIAAAKPSANVSVKPAAAKSSQDQLAAIVARLKKSPSARPRTVTALCQSIKSWLGRQASEADVAKIVQSLKSQNCLKVTDAKKIEYDFSQRPVASTSSLTKTVKTTAPRA